LLYTIGLGLIPGVGDVKAKKLIAYCGSAEAVFKEKKNHLLKIPGIGEILTKEILTQKVLNRAEEELKFIEDNNIKPLFYLSEDYPHRLKHCDDGPLVLFFKGNAELNNQKVISIVGTRSATEYGRAMTNQIVKGLAAYGVLIVSGLAYGIDAAAHKASLDNSLSTVGVLGHGLDTLYPSNNAPLANKMLDNGGLITEFMSKTVPDKENFPKRNRIIAGMSDAVVVIEAAQRGGALITAEIALSYNRDVLAVPGTVLSNYSKGCNKLIKQNKAALIESAEDIIYALGWENLNEVSKKSKSKQKEIFIDLNEDEQSIVLLLKDKEYMSVDDISYALSFSLSKVATLLLNLEFNGVITAMPGKRYKLCL